MQILIKLTNGVLAVCRPSGDRGNDETENDYLGRIAEETVSKCSRDKHAGWDGARVVAFVPDEVVDMADWGFRGAWDWTTPDMNMDYDMEKCRSIHRDRLRSMRIAKLQELDAEYMKADEAGDFASKTRIAHEKQTLRDITADKSIEEATTPNELVVPELLIR